MTVWALPLILFLAPSAARQAAIVTPDYQMVAFELLALGLVMAGCALLPALLVPQMNSTSRILGSEGHGVSRTASRVQSLLIGGQTAIAAPIMVAAVLAAITFAKLLSINPGFEVDQLLTARIALPRGSYETTDDASRLHRMVIDRLSILPDVRGVALGSRPVDYLSGGQGPPGVSITVEGRGRFLNGSEEHEQFTPGRRVVSQEYFHTMGLRLLSGRLFAQSDTVEAHPVAVVNETMARLHWPNADAVGNRINFENVRPGRPLRAPWITVVGVVSDARHHDLDEPPRPEIYVPLAQSDYVLRELSLLIGVHTDPASVAGAVQDVMRRVDPFVPVLEVRTMSDLVGETTAPTRYASSLLAFFAVLGVGLCAAGTYGLAGRAAAGLRKELGIRLALGARRHDVYRIVVFKGLLPALYGLAAGGGLVALAEKCVLVSLTPDLGPVGAGVLAAAFLPIVATALVASFLPAVAAARLDVCKTLKLE